MTRPISPATPRRPTPMSGCPPSPRYAACSSSSRRCRSTTPAQTVGDGRTSPTRWAPPSRPCTASTRPDFGCCADEPATAPRESVMTRCGDPDNARPNEKAAGKFGEWLDPDADQAWRAANQEALDLGHSWVGTEHLLLGLLQLPTDDPAAAILATQDLTADRVRAALTHDLEAAPSMDAKAMLAA